MIQLKKRRIFALLTALCLLTACGGQGEQPPELEPYEPAVSVIAPEPQPEPEPEVLPYINPLTGAGCAEDIGGNRPIAVMINNRKVALPQLGVSQADIIYEVPAEGGITRMLAVFQSVEGVGDIGSVRSARDYYVALAAGLDAIYLHAGGSDGAYNAIDNLGVTALDCVNGPYEGTLYWRDSARRKSAGFEHSVLTSGEKIAELFPTYTRLRLEHNEGYAAPFQFTENPMDGVTRAAETVSVRFSSYKTGVFEYDADSGLYLVSQYGEPHVDGNTMEQLGVRNVLILYTSMKVIDSEGRLSVTLTGSGEGQFVCDGKIMDITWHKESKTAPMTFKTTGGEALELGIGTSYINIVEKGAQVTVTPAEAGGA